MPLPADNNVTKHEFLKGPCPRNGRLMSGLRLLADAAMASALFGLGPEAHQEMDNCAFTATLTRA